MTRAGHRRNRTPRSTGLVDLPPGVAMPRPKFLRPPTSSHAPARLLTRTCSCASARLLLHPSSHTTTHLLATAHLLTCISCFHPLRHTLQHIHASVRLLTRFCSPTTALLHSSRALTRAVIHIPGTQSPGNRSARTSEAVVGYSPLRRVSRHPAHSCPKRNRTSHPPPGWMCRQARHLPNPTSTRAVT